MNIIQLSKHIFKCEAEFLPPTVSIHVPVNIWLVKHNNDVYIIDTAVNELADSHIKAAKAIGNPKAILLTHGHHDHIGGSEKWLKELNLPIYAHPKELVYIRGHTPYRNRGIIATDVASLVQPLTDDTILGLPIKYYHTPGHTSGHVIYFHLEDKLLLTGDLFVTSKEGLHPPLRVITENMDENIQSGSVIDEIKPKIISSSHGDELLYKEGLYEKYAFWYSD